MQVDVFDLPNYELTTAQHEWLWLFAIMVAGKRAEQSRDKLNQLLERYGPRLEGSGWKSDTPYNVVGSLVATGHLGHALRQVRTGQYRRIEAAFKYSVARLIPEKAELAQLECTPGVGPKTARFYYLHTRPGARCAVLDTHILKFLRDQGHDAPRSTPQNGPRYRTLERQFLRICDERGVAPAELDIDLWRKYKKEAES